MGFQKKQKEETKKKIEVTVPSTKAEKFAALLKLSDVLDKEHDTTNTLIRLGSHVGKPLPSIHTGLPSLDDFVFGCGGVPRGSVIEVFGPESSGKTTITLQIIAAEQAAGGLAAFVDAEHALDPTYAAMLGVDVKNLLVNQPDNGEQALDVVRKLINSKCVNVIAVDSVAALVPKAELAGEIGDAHVGLLARLMSQTLRILVGEARRNMVTVLFINQLREKIGVMFGNPETTTGGRALKFYSTIRLDTRRRAAITIGGKDGEVIGHTLELKAVKNKVGTPFRSTTLDLYYPNSGFAPGVDILGDLVTYACKKNVFEVSGSWYSLDLGNVEKNEKTGKETPVGPEQIAQGLPKLIEYIRSSPKAEKIVRDKLAEILKTEVAAAAKPKEEKEGL